MQAYYDITAFLNFNRLTCSVCLGFMVCLRIVLVGMGSELLGGKTLGVTDVMERHMLRR